MKALSFSKAVTLDKSNLLEEVFALLQDNGVRFCVIGGQVVNAYVEPLVSLDLDLAVATVSLIESTRLIRKHFQVESFPHSLNISSSGSNLRVQFQTDPRYGDFVERASMREVLGLQLPVASVEDVLQGKIWAASYSERRSTKRRKDLLDIERLQLIPLSKHACPKKFSPS